MKFVSDPDISVQVNRMKRRVRWQEESLRQRAISQTKLVIDGEDSDNSEFSFNVVFADADLDKAVKTEM